MKEKRPSPVMRLLQWAGPERKWLILSVLCAFGSGILVITSYIGIYRLMDAVLSGACTKAVIADCALLVTAGTVGRLVLLGTSGVLSHKGAYGALFRVRCMVTEHLAKVSLGPWTSGAQARSRPFSMRTSRSWNCFWPTTCRNLWPISQDRL